MDLTLFKEGFVVMVIGMGTVFIFLTIMIWVMNLNSYILKIVNKYFPEEIPVDKTVSKKKSFYGDEEIALAIAAAVHNSKWAIYGK